MLSAAVRRAGIAIVIVMQVAAGLSGCGSLPRAVLPAALADSAQLSGLERIRMWGDADTREIDTIVGAEAGKMRARAMAKIQSGGEPISNYLAISGGAEDGAYGAGLLVGWSEQGTRPQFDLVTGISAGALIAPLAFLGREHDKDLRAVFTHGQEQIFTTNVLSGLLGGPALADSAPLERLIAHYVDQRFLRDVARERQKGRILLIGTTNLDAQRPVIWDMGRIAMSDTPQSLALFRKILLASASIPGAFPPVRIEVQVNGRTYEEMHVDGGVTQQVFLLPSRLAFGEVDKSVGLHVARRLYVIRNGKVSPEWLPVEEKTFSIASRSISTLIKSQGIGDLYRLYAVTRRDGTDFNLATIPADFPWKCEQPFDTRYMAALYEQGYRQGRNGYAWAKVPPGLRVVDSDK